MSEDEIKSILSPEKFTGRSADQVVELLEEYINPILEENKDIIGIQGSVSV